MLRIGSIGLEVPFFLSPMSGYTDAAMRRISRRFGSPMGISGLLMDKMVLLRDGLKQPIAVLTDDEHPVGAQLLGDDPDTMSQAAQKLHRGGYDLIDLNFSCPAPKVVRCRRGGFLLTMPGRILDITRRVRDAVSCPLTIKLRIGYDATAESRDRFRQVCRGAKEIGVDALTIHGRTVEQKFHGQADWNAIAEMKRELPGMVIIGSGDLNTATAAAEKIRSGAADGAAIARGAIGNPWFFGELRALLSGAAAPATPTAADAATVMIEHVTMLKELFGDHKAVVHFRKFLSGYCKRHPRRKQVLGDLMRRSRGDDLVHAIENWNTCTTRVLP
jgi:tRNA-dihydrouridine synthase B